MVVGGLLSGCGWYKTENSKIEGKIGITIDSGEGDLHIDEK